MLAVASVRGSAAALCRGTRWRFIPRARSSPSEGDPMAYKFVDWNEIEPYRGTLRRIRRHLGITAFGVNLHEMPPHADEYPEHSETETNQEELYICLEGGGTITVDGEEIELK